MKTKWVKDLSGNLLKDAKISLLARGSNFAVLPLYSLKGHYIMSVEEPCLKLPQGGSWA